MNQKRVSNIKKIFRKILSKLLVFFSAKVEEKERKVKKILELVFGCSSVLTQSLILKIVSSRYIIPILNFDLLKDFLFIALIYLFFNDSLFFNKIQFVGGIMFIPSIRLIFLNSNSFNKISIC